MPMWFLPPEQHRWTDADSRRAGHALGQELPETLLLASLHISAVLRGRRAQCLGSKPTPSFLLCDSGWGSCHSGEPRAEFPALAVTISLLDADMSANKWDSHESGPTSRPACRGWGDGAAIPCREALPLYLPLTWVGDAVTYLAG